MKILVLFFLIWILFCSCNRTHTVLKENIENADSAAINFFKGDGKMDTVVSVKIVKDKVQLAQLVSLICFSKTNNNADCGVDGSIHFFKHDRVVQDINFSLSKGSCQHFNFRLMTNTGWESTLLNQQAVELLQEIKAGK